MVFGATIKKQKRIFVPEGDVFHALKCTDEEFSKFGEAYFTTVHPGAVKAWTRHKEAILNVIVPVGKIRFVMYDDRIQSSTQGQFQEVILSRDNYVRLTVPPMVWTAFQGLGKTENILLNVCSLPHDPSEADKLDFEDIKYNWAVEIS